MRLSGGDKQERAWLHGPPRGTVKEDAGTGNYDVCLIPGVRRLGIGAPRRIELDAQRAMAKEFQETRLCPALELSQCRAEVEMGGRYRFPAADGTCFCSPTPVFSLISRGRIFSAFGSATVSTPASKVASTFSGSTVLGREKVRSNTP